MQLLTVLRRAALTASAGAYLGIASVAAAATITPNTPVDEYADPGPGAGCSLREAIEAANTDGVFGGCSVANEPLDTILLTPGETYARTLTGDDAINQVGDLDVLAENLAIEVNGPGGAVIQGNGTVAGDRVLDVQSLGIDVSISGVTIQNGNAGGAVGGGGIRSFGDLTLVDSTVSGNATTLDGGGVFAQLGTANLTNVTLSGNLAQAGGGGLFDDSALVVLNNVTVSSNTADSDGAGGGSGGGIARTFFSTPTLHLMNTVVAGNQDLSPSFIDRAPDCSQGPNSLGYNLIGTTLNCNYLAQAGDLTNVAAGLGSLASNGGPTMTHALLPGSPAIEAASPAAPGSGNNACAAMDQRGVSRPQGGRCDIGAFEADASPAAPMLPPPASGPSTGADDAACAALRAKLKKAKSKRQKRKIRAKLRKRGC